MLLTTSFFLHNPRSTTFTKSSEEPRALDINENQLGVDHPRTAKSLHNLAQHYSFKGQHAKAEELYVRALDINENQLGADHPATKITRECLQILRQQ